MNAHAFLVNSNIIKKCKVIVLWCLRAFCWWWAEEEEARKKQPRVVGGLRRNEGLGKMEEKRNNENSGKSKLTDSM